MRYIIFILFTIALVGCGKGISLSPAQDLHAEIVAERCGIQIWKSDAGFLSLNSKFKDADTQKDLPIKVDSFDVLTGREFFTDLKCYFFIKDQIIYPENSFNPYNS